MNANIGFNRKANVVEKERIIHGIIQVTVPPEESYLLKKDETGNE
jgi:hypothetical protein